MKLFITMCLLYITTFVIIVPTLLTTKLVRMLYVTLSVCTVFAMLGLSTTFFFIDVLCNSRLIQIVKRALSFTQKNRIGF